MGNSEQASTGVDERNDCDKNVHIMRGWSTDNKMDVARLYDQAFGHKLAGAIADENARRQILANSFIPSYSFSATCEEKLVGIVGFQTTIKGFTQGISLREVFKTLGLLKGLKACLVFSLFEYQVAHEELVIEGIAVDDDCRGRGIGTQLIEKVLSFAAENHYQCVKLDVIDGNEGAKKLYEQMGFIATKHETFPYLKWLLGFSGATTMTYKILSN